MSGSQRIVREARGDIGALAERGDVMGLTAIIRECAAVTPRIFALPEVKAWCVRRWHSLFLREAVEDQAALAAASLRKDTRPPGQRIAERFLMRNTDAWRDEQPPPIETKYPGTTLLLCPGLANGLLPEREFRDDLSRISWRMRLPVLRSDSHPARSCAANSQDILRALNRGLGRDGKARLIPESDAKIPGKVMVLAYSKGAPDTLTTLVARPDLAPRIACLVTWAGAIGGSQVADDAIKTLRHPKFQSPAGAIRKALKGFTRHVVPRAAISAYRLEEYDVEGALHDLSTSVRSAFLRTHGEEIDTLSIPIFTFRGATSAADVPWSQRRGAKILSDLDLEHDMQVAGSCSRLDIPMATEIAVFRGHHWDIAFPAFGPRAPFSKTAHVFPKTAALTATVQLAGELGLVS